MGNLGPGDLLKLDWHPGETPRIMIWLAPATASWRDFVAQPQKLKVTTTATKAQAAGAGALGVPALVVAIVQLFQIQLTPEQLAALTTIFGAVAAFAGSYFATNSPVVQD